MLGILYIVLPLVHNLHIMASTLVHYNLLVAQEWLGCIWQRLRQHLGTVALGLSGQVPAERLSIFCSLLV